jgi:peptide/nickel transport system substrate-binding protein
METSPPQALAGSGIALQFHLSGNHMQPQLFSPSPVPTAGTSASTLSRRLARWSAAALLAGAAAGAMVPAMAQTTTLKIIPSSNITVLDPIWTTAYVTRNFGYMVYDTLFATDLEGHIKPQMVDKWKVSPDNKTWTFTLRDGLEFHDGKPVTSEDVVASIKRWASRDTFGAQLAKVTERYETPDARTFSIVLKEPFGLVLEALGKPSSNVPVIMPKRIADTSGDTQIKESIGSGPYVFKADEFRPGERVVFTRNTRYKPRAEAPSGTAGGKNVYVDRVEWLIIRDAQTQMNALLNGEADILEQPAFEQYATLRTNPDIKLIDAQPAGNQFILRFNFLQPPFNNEKVRRAKKDAPSAGGWSAFMTSWTASDILNPITMAMMNATGDKGWFGWQTDAKLEEIKVQFAQAKTEADKKKLAQAAQLRAFETATHVPVGQYNQPAAVRKNVSGLVPAGAQVYWNIRKQ